MPNNPFTRYEVDDLVRARKIAGRVTKPGKGDQPLYVELHRADQPAKDIWLRFEGHRPAKALSGVPDIRRPKAVLMWRNRRIRAIEWTIRKDVVQNGVPTGEVVKYWHEHYWTDEDGDNAIRVPKPVPKNEDLSALIEWACNQWNIEGMLEPGRLFQ